MDVQRSAIEDLRGKRVGICLSSGFFGFYAHYGFMRAVTQLGIRPRAIAGCSAGALLGSLWASGLPAHEIETVLKSVGLRDLIAPPRLGEIIGRPVGLISGRRLEAMVKKVLPVETFEQCTIPLAVTTFDLNDSKLKVLDSGPLASAVRASASLPGMFSPARIDGHLCWDGAVAEKAPIESLVRRGDLDVLLVCYLARPINSGPPRTLMAGIRRALDSLVYASDRQAIARSREQGLKILVVAPQVPRCGPYKLSQGRSIMATAEAETRRIFDQGDFGCEVLS